MSRRFAGLLGVLLAACAPLTPERASTATPQRIISVVPSATEMLYAFGAGDKVIAVGDYDGFPPEAAAKPKIGGLLNPNIEKIIEMKPELVITYGSQEVLRERLGALGIRLHPFAHGNIEHTLAYMIDLGRTIGAEDRAAQIVAEIREVFDEVRARAPAKAPKVLLVHNRGAGMLGSFYTVGSRAFQHELITIAGGENLFGDVDRETIQPSLEEVIRRAPDMVVETLPPPLDEGEAEQRARDWEKLGVAKERVCILAESYLLVPGPRLHLAARHLSELLRASRCAGASRPAG